LTVIWWEPISSGLHAARFNPAVAAVADHVENSLMCTPPPHAINGSHRSGRPRWSTAVVQTVTCLPIVLGLFIAVRPAFPAEPAEPTQQPFGMRVRPAAASMEQVYAPSVVAPSPQNEAQIIKWDDRTLRIYYVQRPEGTSIRSVGSTDGGLTWSDDRREFDLPGQAYYAVQIIPDSQGELQAVFHIFRGKGRKLGVDRNLDIWHCRTSGGRTAWGTPQRIFVGYVGSLRGGLQMSSGRLLVPFAIAIPERGTPPPAGEPDFGLHNVIVMYSDDFGATWQRGPAELKVTLCGENNTRYGAVEPHVIQLADGRVWMLIRDRCGRLYESYSLEGIDWSEPQRTRFISSDSPATTVRLPDNRIVLFWCADQRWDDPRSYAMGGREILHAAISSDEGQTWQGFREVLTEPLPPVVRGDRGTAYPSAVCNAAGKVVLASGQGAGRQSVVLFDPDWLTETEAKDDFADGLSQWTFYGAAGARLVDDPDRAGRKLLSLHKLDAEHPAGALWNFPAGASGKLSIRLRLNRGSQGCQVFLTNHFSVIDDKDAPTHAAYQFTLKLAGEEQGTVSLEAEQWHEISVDWPADGGAAQLHVDGKPGTELPLLSPTETGLNYLGVRSLATATEDAELLIESVSVHVDPTAGRAAAPSGAAKISDRSQETEWHLQRVKGEEDGGAVLDLGSVGAFDARWTSCPSVVRHEGEYRMWYSSLYDTKSGPGGIGLATSRDGIHWARINDGHPVLSISAGHFDAGQVMGPNVLHDDQRWLMWYTGMSLDRHESGFGYYRIGAATSPDGIVWTRSDDSPILDVGSTGSSDSVQVATPSVIRETDGYRMWYAAWSPEFNHTISSARSGDGIHWTKDDDGRPVSGLSPSIAFGPAVCRIGDEYLMLYMALRATPGIYAAIGADGRSWRMLNSGQPVLSPGSPDDFDAYLVGHPTILVDGDQLRVWYTGYRRNAMAPEGLELRIGLAEGSWPPARN
jgi:hypothetical protein